MHYGSRWRDDERDAAVGQVLFNVVTSHRARDLEAERVAKKALTQADAPNYDQPHLKWLALVPAGGSSVSPAAAAAAPNRSEDPSLEATANDAQHNVAHVRVEAPLHSIPQVDRGDLNPATEGIHNFNSVLTTRELTRRFGQGQGFSSVIAGRALAESPFAPIPAQRKTHGKAAAAETRGLANANGRVEREWFEDAANSDVHDLAIVVAQRGRRGRFEISAEVEHTKKRFHGTGDNVSACTSEKAKEELLSVGAEPAAHPGSIPPHVVRDILAMRERREVMLREWRRDVAIWRRDAPRYAIGAGGDPILMHLVQQSAIATAEDEIVRRNIASMTAFLGGADEPVIKLHGSDDRRRARLQEMQMKKDATARAVAAGHTVESRRREARRADVVDYSPRQRRLRREARRMKTNVVHPSTLFSSIEEGTWQALRRQTTATDDGAAAAAAAGAQTRGDVSRAVGSRLPPIREEPSPARRQPPLGLAKLSLETACVVDEPLPMYQFETPPVDGIEFFEDGLDVSAGVQEYLDDDDAAAAAAAEQDDYYDDGYDDDYDYDDDEDYEEDGEYWEDDYGEDEGEATVDTRSPRSRHAALGLLAGNSVLPRQGGRQPPAAIVGSSTALVATSDADLDKEPIDSLDAIHLRQYIHDSLESPLDIATNIWHSLFRDMGNMDDVIAGNPPPVQKQMPAIAHAIASNERLRWLTDMAASMRRVDSIVAEAAAVPAPMSPQPDTLAAPPTATGTIGGADALSQSVNMVLVTEHSDQPTDAIVVVATPQANAELQSPAALPPLQFADDISPHLPQAARRQLSWLDEQLLRYVDEVTNPELRSELKPSADFFCAIGGQLLITPVACATSLRSQPVDDTKALPTSAEDVQRMDEQRVVVVEHLSWAYVQQVRSNEECEDEDAWTSCLLCVVPQPLHLLESRVWEWRRRIMARVHTEMNDLLDLSLFCKALTCTIADEAVWRSECRDAVSTFSSGRHLASRMVVESDPMKPSWPTLQPIAAINPREHKPHIHADTGRRRVEAQSAVRQSEGILKRMVALERQRETLSQTLAQVRIEHDGTARDCRRGHIKEMPCEESVLRSVVMRAASKSEPLDDTLLTPYVRSSHDTHDLQWVESGYSMCDIPASAFRRLRGLHRTSSAVWILLRAIDACLATDRSTLASLQRLTQNYTDIVNDVNAFRQRHRLEWGPKYLDSVRATYSVLSMLKTGQISAAGNMQQLRDVAKFLRVDSTVVLNNFSTLQEDARRMMENNNLRLLVYGWGEAVFKNFDPEASPDDAADVTLLQPTDIVMPPASVSVHSFVGAALLAWAKHVRDKHRPQTEGQDTSTALLISGDKSMEDTDSKKESKPLVPRRPSGPRSTDSPAAMLQRQLAVLTPGSLKLAYEDMLPYKEALRAAEEGNRKLEAKRRQTLVSSSSPARGRATWAAQDIVDSMKPEWTVQGAKEVALLKAKNEANALANRTLARPVGENRTVPWWHFAPPAYFKPTASSQEIAKDPPRRPVDIQQQKRLQAFPIRDAKGATTTRLPLLLDNRTIAAQQRRLVPPIPHTARITGPPPAPPVTSKPANTSRRSSLRAVPVKDDESRM